MPDTQNHKLLLITYYWPPAGGPGVQRWLKFTQYLPEFGITPYVLTVDEQKASYALRDPSLINAVNDAVRVSRTNTRELYSLYLRITRRENIPFSGFVRENKPSLRENLIRFLRTQLFIPDPRKGWNRYAFKEASRLVETEAIQTIVTTGPPHSSHLTGVKLKKKYPSLKWIADFRDPWTHIFFFDALNHSFYSRRRHKFLELKVLMKSDKILVVSNSMKDDFLQDHPDLPEDKIHVLPNGFDEKDFSGARPEPEQDFTITYTGTLAENYKIDHFIDTLVELHEEKNTIRMRFVGEISDHYRSLLLDKLGERSVQFIDRVSHEKSIRYMLQAQMLLLVIPEAPGNKAILTGKLFEYLASRKPIIGVGPTEGDAAKILQETDAGVMFDYTDSENLKRYILRVKEKMGHEGYYTDYAPIEKYSRRMLTREFVSIAKTI